jgi:hypothetical protein
MSQKLDNFNFHPQIINTGAGNIIVDDTGIPVSGGPFTSLNFVNSSGVPISGTGGTATIQLLPTPGTNGNVLQSNGTNWTSAALSLTLAGDVTGALGSNTISAGAVTLAKMANLSANTIIGNNTGASATPTALTVAQVQTLLGVPVGANPTATVGLTAVNGSSTSFMRADAAPALSQGIAPTWTGAHVWSNTATFNDGLAVNNAPAVFNYNLYVPGVIYGGNVAGSSVSIQASAFGDGTTLSNAYVSIGTARTQGVFIGSTTSPTAGGYGPGGVGTYTEIDAGQLVLNSTGGTSINGVSTNIQVANASAFSFVQNTSFGGQSSATINMYRPLLIQGQSHDIMISPGTANNAYFGSDDSPQNTAALSTHVSSAGTTLIKDFTTGKNAALQITGGATQVIVGGFGDHITSISDTAYTVVVTDSTIYLTSINAPRAWTLPSTGVFVGQRFTIKATSTASLTSTNKLTITPASGTIDGAANLQFTTPLSKATVQWDGTNYNIVA